MPLFQRGTHFAGHVIVRLLGSGRMAEVYEVIAPDGRRRALKVFKHDAPLDAKPQARLGQEGEALATIEHVNVVRFFDAGVDHGRVWILLELVEGLDLRRLVTDAGGALPVERAVRIVRQACEGVAAAHRLGILHRDLSPENILVAADDVAKVADFGSAKLAGYGVKTTSEQDVASSLYMAPEYMTSRVAEERSDVYSVGLVLYEILAGAHPIASRTAPAMEICRRQLAHEPAPLASVLRDVPGDLSDLVQRVTAKDPARRGSMGEMAEGLAVVLQRMLVQRRAAARSLPLPNREAALALTELAMPAFGGGGTISMAAFPATAASNRASSAQPASGSPSLDVSPSERTPSDASGNAASSHVEAAREASPPPAPRGVPATLRSAWQPAIAPARTPVSPHVAIIDRASSTERASTAVPVERSTTSPRESARTWPRVLVGISAVLAIGLLATGWLVAGRASGTTTATATPSPAASPSTTLPPPSASARPSQPPAATTSTPVQSVSPSPSTAKAPPRPRVMPPPSRRPLP